MVHFEKISIHQSGEVGSVVEWLSLVHDAAGSSPSSIYLSMMRRNLGEVLPEEK